MSREIGLKGGKELMEFLEAFPTKLQKGALRAGATAAAKPIRDQARANAKGRIKKTIKTSSPRIDQNGTLSVKVQLRGPNAFIGTFLEYGVAPHIIAPRDARPMGANNKPMSNRLLTKAGKRGGITDAGGGVLKIGEHFVAGAVQHPGFAAKPFLRPALDTKADEAIKAFGERLRSYLQSKTAFTAPVTLEVDE